MKHGNEQMYIFLVSNGFLMLIGFRVVGSCNFEMPSCVGNLNLKLTGVRRRHIPILYIPMFPINPKS